MKTAEELMLRACQEDWDVVMDVDAEHEHRLMCALRISLLRPGLAERGQLIDDYIMGTDGLLSVEQRKSLTALLAESMLVLARSAGVDV